MRQRAFCVYCGIVINANGRVCVRHKNIPRTDAHFSPLSTGLSTKQAAPRREAIAPQIGADPA